MTQKQIEETVLNALIGGFYNTHGWLVTIVEFWLRFLCWLCKRGCCAIYYNISHDFSDGIPWYLDNVIQVTNQMQYWKRSLVLNSLKLLLLQYKYHVAKEKHFLKIGLGLVARRAACALSYRPLISLSLQVIFYFGKGLSHLTALKFSRLLKKPKLSS